jgi:mono/diheme cytochrome c family protein
LIAGAFLVTACGFSLTEPVAAPAPAATTGCSGDALTCQGIALVQARCAKCHAIALEGNSPYPGAQPFRKLSERWTRPALRDALRAGILAQHEQSQLPSLEMKLTDSEIDALFAFLDTLKGTPPAPNGQ